jgi:2-dehydro-3-deoxyphosphogluconate aldolase/(4S)-4-hydroxy-2-oxoglutarate aldolase
VGGPAYLKSLRGPFDKAQFMPSGGVTAQNAKDWLKAGAVAVSAGSSLASTDSLISGDHARIAAAAAEFVNALR